MIFEILIQIPTSMPDGGVIYAETRPEHFIVEPWNAYSSLAFLLPVIYWAIKLRGQYRQNSFLTFCIPLLAVGGIGSTVYHAFRNSRWLLMMDVLPIAVLTLAVSLYFWWRVLPHWGYVFMVATASLLMRFTAFDMFAGQTAVNLAYLINGITLFLPALMLLWKTKFRGWNDIVLATAFFILALVFRKIDDRFEWMVMGTHWLWHICTAVGVFFLADYLYLINHLMPIRKQEKMA
jgi:hemolysin III